MGINKHELKHAQLMDHLERLENGNQWKDALKVCDQVIKAAKKVGEGDLLNAYHKKVLIAYELKAYKDAIKALKFLHKKQSNDDEWVVLLASAYGEAKKYKDAVKYFEIAFQRLKTGAEDYPAVVNGLISMYYESKQFDRGIKFLSGVGLDKDEHNPSLLVALGNFCMKKESNETVEEAMRWFERAVKADKNHKDSKYALQVIELFLQEENTYKFLQDVKDLHYTRDHPDLLPKVSED